MGSVQSEYKVVIRWQSKYSVSQGTEAKGAKDEVSSPRIPAKKMKLTLNIDVFSQRCLGFKTHTLTHTQMLCNESSYLMS